MIGARHGTSDQSEERGLIVGQRVFYALQWWLVGAPIMKDRLYWLRQGDKVTMAPADQIYAFRDS